MVTTADFYDAPQAALVKGVENIFLSGEESPKLAVVQQFADVTHFLRQFCEDGRRFAEPPVDLSIHGQIVCDGGAEVGELIFSCALT